MYMYVTWVWPSPRLKIIYEPGVGDCSDDHRRAYNVITNLACRNMSIVISATESFILLRPCVFCRCSV